QLACPLARWSPKSSSRTKPSVRRWVLGPVCPEFLSVTFDGGDWPVPQALGTQSSDLAVADASPAKPIDRSPIPFVLAATAGCRRARHLVAAPAFRTANARENTHVRAT